MDDVMRALANRIEWEMGAAGFCGEMVLNLGEWDVIIAALREEPAALALERAAKLADDEDGDLTTCGEDRNTRVAQQAAARIAAAIRALRDDSGEARR